MLKLIELAALFLKVKWHRFSFEISFQNALLELLIIGGIYGYQFF